MFTLRMRKERKAWETMSSVTAFLSFFFFFFNLFIYFWLHWVFTAVHGLSLVTASEGYSLFAAHGLFIAVASLVMEHGL